MSGFKLVGVGVVHLDESPTLLRHLRQEGAYHRGVVQSGLVRLAKWRSVVCEAETMAMSSQRREGE